MRADSSDQALLQAAEAGDILGDTPPAPRAVRGGRCAAGAAVASVLGLLATAAIARHCVGGTGGVFAGPQMPVIDFAAAQGVKCTCSKGLRCSCSQGHQGASKSSKSEPCAWKGDNCTQSHCCLDGGDNGFQCYQRDEDWAVCDESCKKGEHEEDDIVGYNEWGDPFKFTWSCKKLGERSEPGCQMFKKNACPKDRCEWRADKCRSLCSYFPDDETCSGEDGCSWYGETCKEACRSYRKEEKCTSEENGDRCQWKAGMCVPGCWTYFDSDSCLAGDQCFWHRQGPVPQGFCEEDPCSSPVEDCTKTKCCSAQRGARGMACFQKNETYASCDKTCSKQKKKKGWTCEMLGKPTNKTQLHCSWPGQDCSKTGRCCKAGDSCMVQDDFFTGCVQTHTFEIVDGGGYEQVPVDLPKGWPADPEFKGGGQLEYQMPPAEDGEEVAGTDLYCVMGYLPGSYEERLMELARANNASIYACDAYDVYHTQESDSANWDSQETTLQNTDVFIGVWQEIKKTGRLWSYSWTVKVDPDALLVPERLKLHLEWLKVPKGQPVYVKNNDLPPFQGNSGFLGAVEVFSKEALELYYRWWPNCKKSLGVKTGEDGYMKGCMDALGVGYMLDASMFKADDNVAICKMGEWAAYHPVKDQKLYQCCIDVLNGQDRDTDWGQCNNMPVDWATLTWPDAGEEGMEPRWKWEENKR